MGFNNPNLLIRQPVEVVHEAINLLVGRVNLALELGLVVRRLGRGQPLLQVQHPLDKRHHLVVLDLVGFVGEVEGPDRSAA